MISLDNVYPQYITDEKGKKKSVILSISKFQELIEDIGSFTVDELKTQLIEKQKELIEKYNLFLT